MPNAALAPDHSRAVLAQLFQAAVRSAQPASCLPAYLPPPPRGRTLVLGAGKAAAAMAHALQAAWPLDKPLSGMVITRYGHVPPLPADADPVRYARVHVAQAAHPVPDAAGLAAAQRMLGMTRGLTVDDLVICLMSGGASALLSLPAPGLDFADKQRIHHALLHSGASIADINCVRRHLSGIKGGRLALACGPARVLTLAISDVPGDDLATIGSGPTVGDDSTCQQALHILTRHGIALPPAVRQGLLTGALESVKPAALSAPQHTARLVATPHMALQAAARQAQALGLAAHVLGDRFEGEAREMARAHAALAQSIAAHGQPFARPCVLLSGGEATVSFGCDASGPQAGRGGRAGEFCLSLALTLGGQPGVWALAADTDGIDGTGGDACDGQPPVAGAFVAPDTLARAAASGLDAAAHLAAHDSHTFFARMGDALRVGPTYTNVNDFRALLLWRVDTSKKIANFE